VAPDAVQPKVVVPLERAWVPAPVAGDLALVAEVVPVRKLMGQGEVEEEVVVRRAVEFAVAVAQATSPESALG
jgi:hypothetical protein